MAITSLLFIFALFFCCYLNKTLVSGAGYHVVEMNSLVRATTCSSYTKGLVHGLQIASSYGPCSPIGQENSTLDSSKILQKDQSRVGSMNSLTSNKHTTDEEKVSGVRLFGPKIGAGNFVVTVGFGSPKRDFTLIFDTGSNITWIKCKPCSKNCHPHQGSIYNPYESSTFSNATCDSSCSYSQSYMDDSYSEGYYIRDTLTVSPSDVFSNFVFGCSQKDTPGKFGTAAGLLGVGQYGDYSLISQTAKTFAKTFCYCLPAGDSSTGYLLFGRQALETCQTSKFTSLLSDRARPDYYFVNLIGISIGKFRLKVSSYLYSSPNTILDSGTIITRLPPSVYSALRAAFQELMSQYPRAPKLQPILDTCYNLENYKNVTIPSMAMHFPNSVDVDLDSSAVIFGDNNSQVCLAFAENSDTNDLTIIGNHQQRKLNVLYDIQDRKVAFGIGGCG